MGGRRGRAPSHLQPAAAPRGRDPSWSDRCGPAAHLAGIQVGGVLHAARVVAVVPLLDHRVKDVGEHLEAEKGAVG